MRGEKEKRCVRVECERLGTCMTASFSPSKCAKHQHHYGEWRKQQQQCTQIRWIVIYTDTRACARARVRGREKRDTETNTTRNRRRKKTEYEQAFFLSSYSNICCAWQDDVSADTDKILHFFFFFSLASWTKDATQSDQMIFQLWGKSSANSRRFARYLYVASVVSSSGRGRSTYEVWRERGARIKRKTCSESIAERDPLFFFFSCLANVGPVGSSSAYQLILSRWATSNDWTLGSREAGDLNAQTR